MKANKSLTIFLIFFIILSLALSRYIFYDKVYQKDNHNIINEETTKEEYVKKINSKKYWIYDADYEKNTLADSYVVGTEPYYAEDIKVPYINIDSAYANKANQELKKVFDNAISIYNEGVQNELTHIDIDYQKYIDNDIASTALWYKKLETAVVNQNYYTYNISLKNGAEMSF